jgi:hypothetical protein
MKRRLTKREYDWLQKELTFLQQQKQLSAEKTAEILSLYEIKGSYNLLRVCLTMGALLIGVGMLSFIASNWDQLPTAAKFSLILIGLIGTNLAGWRWEKIYPKTAQSLYYVGMFIYGAGIFLIGQMFHLSLEIPTAFLIWAIGLLPLILYLRDRWAHLMLILLLFLSTFLGHEQEIWRVIPFLPSLFWFQLRYYPNSKWIFFVQNLFAVYVLANMVIGLGWGDWVPIVVFLCGVAYSLSSWKPYQKALQWLGAFCYGVGGISLTFKSIWPPLLTTHSKTIAILFIILYIFWLAYLLKRHHLSVIVVICALILRFYIDLSFDFLPKSLFFIMGGLILIAGGYWFERQRRKGRQAHEEVAE